MQEVQLSIGTFTKSVLLHVAGRSGGLRRAGIDITEQSVASSPAQFRSLEAGELDLVLTSPDNTLAYRFVNNNPLGRILDVEILAAIDRGLGLSLCLAPQLDDIDFVRGHVVGVDVPRSGFAFVAYALLEGAGLLPGDYEVEALGSTPRRASALIAGNCSATVLNAGNELHAEGSGCTIVSRVSRLGPYLGTVLAAMATPDPSEQSGRLRFADVLLETSQEICAGQWESEVIEAGMTLLGLTSQEAQAHHACLLDPLEGLIPDGIVDRASVTTLIELRHKYLPAAQLHSIAENLGSLVVERALKESSGTANE